jgi:hypothetical protein
MGALHPADQVFQTRPNLDDLHLATFTGEFLIDRAVDKEEAARKTFTGAGVSDGMLEHGDPVVFPGQGRVGLTAALLLDGQEARLLPVQAVGVRVLDLLMLVPAHGAQGIEAVAVQATDVLGGIGAAVGDHEQAGEQWQVLVQELELFGDGASAVAVSIQALTEDGQTTLAIDHGVRPTCIMSSWPA